MAGTEKPERTRMLRFITALPHMGKVVQLLNRLMISTLGVRVVSARVKVIDKNWFDRLLYFQRLLDLLKGVEGDVVECGVASGNSLTMLASYRWWLLTCRLTVSG